MRLMHTVMLALGCATATGAIAQTLYKWTDANGTVHYSELPPPHGKASTFNLHSGKTASPATASSSAAEQAGFQADDKAFRTTACTSAQRDLAALASGKMVVGGGSLGTPADIGQATKLTSEQRESARAEAAKRVHDYCGQG